MGVRRSLTWRTSMLLQQARSGALQECLRRYAVAFTLRRFSDSLHVSLEPLQDENEGIFSLTLSRPSARNAIGTCTLSCHCHWNLCSEQAYLIFSLQACRDQVSLTLSLANMAYMATCKANMFHKLGPSVA